MFKRNIYVKVDIGINLSILTSLSLSLPLSLSLSLSLSDISMSLYVGTLIEALQWSEKVPGTRLEPCSLLYNYNDFTSKWATN